MLKTHMAACLVATMFAAPAFAQTPAPPSTSPSAPNSSMTAPAAPSSAMPSSPMAGHFLTKIEPMHVMASELIGTRVVSANNESIGDINDVIVDRKGQAIAAVVGVGGFLGIGEKDVAVPFEMLEFATREQASAMSNNVTSTGSTSTNTGATTNAPATTGSTPTTTADKNGQPERVILRMTKAELQSAPAFDTDRDAATTGTTTGTSNSSAPKSSAPMTPVTPAPKP
jgi:sporulation protein YlmC with PRC-barrel domain